MGCKKIVGLLIVAFWMYCKDTGRVEGHGRIYPYRNIGYPALIVQKMKAKNQLLRALHCKSWNDELASPLRSPIYDIFEVLKGIHCGFMETISIGAIENEKIYSIEALGVFDYGLAFAA